MTLPTVKDCVPGSWLKLSNGWVVGPVVETEFTGVYVRFDTGTWQVDVIDHHGTDESSSRLVVEVLRAETPIEDLIRTAAMVLYKFTEGKEDWTEWRDLADALDNAMPECTDAYTAEKASVRVSEFYERLEGSV